MASFIAKQMVGNQLKSVKGALGEDKKEDEEKKTDVEEEEDPEIAEARREAEERRAEKHRKMEEEREEMRQTIRDKYGLKKREEPKELEADGRIGRKKKTPEEMAAEANEEEDDEFSNSMFPKNLDEFKTKVTEIPNSVMNSVSEAREKCSVQ